MSFNISKGCQDDLIDYCNDSCCQHNIDDNHFDSFLNHHHYINNNKTDNNTDKKLSDNIITNLNKTDSLDQEIWRLNIKKDRKPIVFSKNDDNNDDEIVMKTCSGEFSKDFKEIDDMNSKKVELSISPLLVDADSGEEIERDDERGVYYRRFSCEEDLEPIIELIAKDLSEPYSVYTYRYFIYNWPRMCIMAFSTEGGKCIGAIVGKTERYRHDNKLRGYIAMLAVQEEHRRKMIGSRLVELVIDTMIEEGSREAIGCSEVVLETEITNTSALRLYEKLGFLRDKRLFRYYLNGVDAFRLKLWLP